MNKINIIFESPRKWHAWLIKIYLACGFKVWIIEPFSAYHHDKTIRFHPELLPAYIVSLLGKGRIKLLPASKLEADQIYFLAADKAVEDAEGFFGAYKSRHYGVIQYVCSCIGSSVAENTFKKQACDKLGKFYSVNIMLSKIERNFPFSGVIKVYPEINLFFYHSFKKMLIQNGLEILKHQKISFTFLAYLSSLVSMLKDNFKAIFRLFIQVIGGVIYLKNSRGASGSKVKGSYKYGITITSPSRQLVNNKRGPDFLIDNKTVRNEDVVYFPLRNLKNKERNALFRLNSKIYYLPDRKTQNFSNFRSWLKLFYLCLKEELFNPDLIINEAHLILSEYFRWQNVLRHIEIKHLISHADVGFLHIPRNIALAQKGVQTWYFIDSINYSFNFANQHKNNHMRHPLWAYPYYDHFISWEKSLNDYFSLHPNSLKEYHLIGCLWSEHINHTMPREESLNSKFVIAAFDTSYTQNSFTSYKEGIIFAQHLLKLADELEDIAIIFKRKKDRSTHKRLDPVLGPKLADIYEQLSKHSRIRVFADTEDSSALISCADMTVSFPFTSTTFEALSVNRPAIWHDPLGYYRSTPYGIMGGVTAHSYEELKTKVIQIKNIKPCDYKNPIPSGSPFMDPFRDGKAIDRFRKLLLTE